jgi:hypothetical protein
MGVVIEICVKYPGGPTWINATDMCKTPGPGASLGGRNLIYVTDVWYITTPIAPALKNYKLSVAFIQFDPSGAQCPESGTGILY